MIRHIARFGLLLSLFIWGFALSFAQSGNAQICVRSYDDRNSNGQFDPGEPLITRGIGLSLSNVAGVIVETALLESSPQAAQGIVCFQRLEAGQYTVDVSSADYQPTGAQAFVVVVSDTSLPQVEDYGAQAIVSTVPVAQDDEALSETALAVLLERLFFSGIGAIVVICLMIVVGTLIFFFFVRHQQPRPAYPTGVTGQMPPVRPITGQMPPVTPAQGMRPVTPPPSSGNMPPIPPPADDDTNTPF